MAKKVAGELRHIGINRKVALRPIPSSIHGSKPHTPGGGKHGVTRAENGIIAVVTVTITLTTIVAINAIVGSETSINLGCVDERRAAVDTASVGGVFAEKFVEHLDGSRGVGNVAVQN